MWFEGFYSNLCVGFWDGRRIDQLVERYKEGNRSYKTKDVQMDVMSLHVVHWDVMPTNVELVFTNVTGLTIKTTH